MRYGWGYTKAEPETFYRPVLQGFGNPLFGVYQWPTRQEAVMACVYMALLNPQDGSVYRAVPIPKIFPAKEA